MKQLLMEANQWNPKLKSKCQSSNKSKKRKVNNKEDIASIIASASSNDAGIIENKKHEHTSDCCQYGRLLHLTKCKETRNEDTHLATLVKKAGYQIYFIPKYRLESISRAGDCLHLSKYRATIVYMLYVPNI